MTITHRKTTTSCSPPSTHRQGRRHLAVRVLRRGALRRPRRRVGPRGRRPHGPALVRGLRPLRRPTPTPPPSRSSTASRSTSSPPRARTSTGRARRCWPGTCGRRSRRSRRRRTRTRSSSAAYARACPAARRAPRRAPPDRPADPRRLRCPALRGPRPRQSSAAAPHREPRARQRRPRALLRRLMRASAAATDQPPRHARRGARCTERWRLGGFRRRLRERTDASAPRRPGT